MNRVFKENDDLNIIEQLDYYICKVDKDWKNNIEGIDRYIVEQVMFYTGLQEEKSDDIKAFKEYMISAGKNDGGLIENAFFEKFSVEKILKKYMEIYKKDKKLLDINKIEFLSSKKPLGDIYSYILEKNSGNYYVVQEIDEGSVTVNKNIKKHKKIYYFLLENT